MYSVAHLHVCVERFSYCTYLMDANAFMRAFLLPVRRKAETWLLKPCSYGCNPGSC